ncbi:MAG: plastocyanin/azurin family copper-binding protein [Anaerolineales bacterium]|jgi:plastocyanin
MYRKFVFLFIVLIGVFALSACGASGPDKISVTTTDFKFEPTNWTVSAGNEVELTLTNDGTLEHEWVIIKQGMEVTIPFDEDDEDKVYWEMEAQPGETKTETFTAPSEAGTYTVVCGIPAHLEQGMTGTLIVE